MLLFFFASCFRLTFESLSDLDISPEECCYANFDAIDYVYIDQYYNDSDAECKVRDVCYLGTEPPTPAPVTNEPTSSEPSATPTGQPSITPYHLRSGTYCTARWHISRVDSTRNTW